VCVCVCVCVCSCIDLHAHVSVYAGACVMEDKKEVERSWDLNGLVDHLDALSLIAPFHDILTLKHI